MKKNFLSNPALTIFLAFMLPVVFFFAQNGYGFYPKVILLSLGVMLLLSLLMGMGVFFIHRKCEVFFKKLPVIAQKIIIFLFCVIIVEILYFWLQFYRHEIFAQEKFYDLFCFFLIPLVLFFSLACTSGFRVMNTFLGIFILISSVSIVNQLNSDQGKIESTFPLHYSLKKRPNIYLFYQESLHSLDIQKDIYGIDSSDLKAYLKNKGFSLYEEPTVYSNSSGTLSSMADTFTFTPTWNLSRGNADVYFPVRGLISGDEGNTLFRILKENNYKTIRLLKESIYQGYYGTFKGKYLDDSNESTGNGFGGYFVNTINSLGLLNQKVKRAGEKLSLYFAESSIYSSTSLETNVATALNFYKDFKEPRFFVFKGGATHTVAGSYKYSPAAMKEWIELYREAVAKGNKKLRSICDMIIENDPGALIIMIGDHGAWRFRGADQGAKSIAEMKENLKKQNISWKDFCEDKFSVFLSIRLPYGEMKDISHGLRMSQVNLFRHVFSYLNDDKDILSTRVPTDSYMGSFKLMSDGQIIENP